MSPIAPRPLVYMDHWAMVDISADSALRPRMLRVLEHGTLLFSFMHLLEIARTKGETFENIATFIEQVGSHWAPISLSSSVVARRQRQGILEPWRADYFDHWMKAPKVEGKLSNLVRRLTEPWAAQQLEVWERQEAGDIAAMITLARERVRNGTLKLDATSDVPHVLDAKGVFATVIQRYVRGSLNIERHQIDDLLHTIVPVACADVVFLDRKTKDCLLQLMDTRAKIFSKREIDAAFQHLETFGAA